MLRSDRYVSSNDIDILSSMTPSSTTALLVVVLETCRRGARTLAR